MKNTDAKELLEKYRAGNCTPDEKALVETYYNQFRPAAPYDLPGDVLETELTSIYDRLPGHHKQIVHWPRIAAAAAAILIIITTGSYFFLYKSSEQQIAQSQFRDIAPGSNQATLTLANGRKIIIKKGISGNLARQGSTLVQIKDSNAIAYITSAKNQENIKVEYNTLSTARGEQSPLPLVLTDGTKVWLNAASSITFPTAFNGKSRKVTVTGEAYFEVTHNANKPFSVEANGQTVEDIGTSFNINAYSDEPVIKTTLLEGSIKLIKGSNESILQPGQQASTQVNQDKIGLKYINTEPVTAWRNGYFRFDNVGLADIMRQFSRWYDIEVVYDGQIPEHEFVGKISRNSNLSKVLKVLALGGVHYKIDGKKLIIQP